MTRNIFDNSKQYYIVPHFTISQNSLFGGV